MQFGAGTFIWESPFSTSEHLYLVEVELGSDVVAGPMYSSVGKAHLPTEAESEAEWQRAVCIWREIAPDQDSIAVEGLRFLLGLMTVKA